MEILLIGFMKIDLRYIALISLRSFRLGLMFDGYFDLLLLMLPFGLFGDALNWLYKFFIGDIFC